MRFNIIFILLKALWNVALDVAAFDAVISGLGLGSDPLKERQ